VFQALVAACHAHPAHVDDPATRLHDEAACLFGRQPGREHHAARAHRDVPVPPDDLDGTVVILVTLHTAGEIVGRAPSAVNHGAPAQPECDLALGSVGRHPVVERRPRQYSGDEAIERQAIHGKTLPRPTTTVNREAPIYLAKAPVSRW